jgi:hypothetical protein
LGEARQLARGPSLGLDSDYFGHTELMGAINALYQCVARAALAELRDLGFVVSEYLGKDGEPRVPPIEIGTLITGRYLRQAGDRRSRGRDDLERGASCWRWRGRREGFGGERAQGLADRAP